MEDQVAIADIADALSHAGGDHDDVAWSHRLLGIVSESHRAVPLRDQVALDDAAKPVRPGRDTGGHSCPRDGNGRVLRAVPGLEDGAALRGGIFASGVGADDDRFHGDLGKWGRLAERAGFEPALGC